MIVKRGDKFPLTFTATDTDTGDPVSLGGTTTRLIVRHGNRQTGVLEVLPTTLGPNPGEVIHTLDGTWELGAHYLELEVTDAGEVRTSPSSTYVTIRIIPDLDNP